MLPLKLGEILRIELNATHVSKSLSRLAPDEISYDPSNRLSH
jgi:hypothetical protein